MAMKMIIPKVDIDQETVTVLEWLKIEGQQVEEGEIILVIETDKITIDVESPGTGTLAGISAHAGDVIPIGTAIAYILAEGEELPEDAAKPTTAPDSPAEEALISKEGDQPHPDITSPSQVQAGEQIPLTGMRRTIAQRLITSHRTIPHIRLSGRVDMTNINKVRQDYNDLETLGGDNRVSITVMLVKLVAMTLADHPLLNSSLQEEAIILHGEVNIGLVVALENGLIIPVIRNANQKNIREIADESADLISRAREGALTSKDIKGATFTISNLGPFGVETFNAIINPPEVAVLAIGATLPTVVPLEDGKVAVRPYMRFTLSADHRVVDGAVAAKFIADLKANLEDPSIMDD